MRTELAITEEDRPMAYMQLRISASEVMTLNDSMSKRLTAQTTNEIRPERRPWTRYPGNSNIHSPGICCIGISNAPRL